MDLQSLVTGVEAYTRQRLSQYIEELRELCAIDSDSYHKSGLDEMALFLAARMRGPGMQVTIIERQTWGNDLYGVLSGDGGRNVLLLGHMDTVYPVGTAAARPLQVQGDIIYGPGVVAVDVSSIWGIASLLPFSRYGG